MRKIQLFLPQFCNLFRNFVYTLLPIFHFCPKILVTPSNTHFHTNLHFSFHKVASTVLLLNLSRPNAVADFINFEWYKSFRPLKTHLKRGTSNISLKQNDFKTSNCGFIVLLRSQHQPAKLITTSSNQQIFSFKVAFHF